MRPLLVIVLVVLVAVVACADGSARVDNQAPPILPPGMTGAADDAFAPDTLGAAVELLSTGDFADRSPGSIGDHKAADYVAGKLEALNMGVKRQAFTDSRGRETENVIAVWASTGESPDVIVVGAHRDHLAADGATKYPGANDNASGTVGMLAIAKTLSALPAPKRTVVFVSLGSEEDPFQEGARHLLKDQAGVFDIANVVFMVDLDMIGTYNAEELVYALGSVSSETGRAILETRAEESPLEFELDDAAEGSASVAFCNHGIPYTTFYTTDPECYRGACDTADRIDTTPMANIAMLAAELTAELAMSDADLAAERDENGCVDF